MRLETRNLTGPRCRYDNSHGVEISIVVVVGVTGVVRKHLLGTCIVEGWLVFG